MVILNDVVPINYNKMKKLLWEKFDEKVLKILDNIFYNCSEEDKKKYIKYIYKNMKEELKEIMNNNNFIDLSMNYNYCNHIYKRGANEGKICGAKIFINKSNNYLCSRHCRNYEPIQRKYNIKTPRCNHTRNNGKQCKHKSLKNNIYCYIHEKLYPIDNEIIKLKKIKHLRILYNKNKYRNKYKKNKTFSKNSRIIFKKKEHDKNHKDIFNDIFFENTLKKNKYTYYDIT